jgi:hypothetical protein
LRAGWFREQLDDYYELIEPSARRDWDRWGTQHQEYFSAWDPIADGFEGEREYLYEWIDARALWMESRVSF